MTRKKGQVPGLETIIYLVLIITFFVFVYIIVKKIFLGSAP